MKTLARFSGNVMAAKTVKKEVMSDEIKVECNTKINKL